MKLGMRSTEPDTGTGSLCFCAAASMISVMCSQISLVHMNRKAYLKTLRE